MKLEDLAQRAARQARSAAQEMPVVDITTARRQRRTLKVLVPVLGVAAAWVVVAVLIPPPTATPPAATNPTVSTIGNTETSLAEPDVFVTETVVITDSDVSAFPDRTDSIMPSTAVDVEGGTHALALAPGLPGELLKLEPQRILSVADQTTVLASWTDLGALALANTTEGILVYGTNSSFESLLRLYGRDGQLQWSLSVPLREDLQGGSQLAVDAGGVIWQGFTDLFPEGSGFAPVQWISVATLDGELIAVSQRAESRPLPDGRSIGISETSASLIGADGRGIRWELPASLTVVDAESFLDGILVTAIDDPAAESGRMLAVFLRPAAAPTGIWIDRHWGRWTPGPTTVAVTDQAIFGLGRTEDGVDLSATSVETLYPVPPFSLDGVDWIGVDHQTTRSADGTILARGRYAFPGRPSAWDEETGVVTFGEDGLLWMRPDGESAQTLPSEAIAELVEVVKGDSGHTVGARPFQSLDTIIWFELETGRRTDPPSSARTLDGLTFTAQGRTATIAQPDWRNVERGEPSELVLPYDLPELVVTSQDGTELLRMVVGTNDRPFVQIHDFDGRRLILDATPQEPASPPQTVWVIDLECSDCTQAFLTGHLVWFDLIGTVETASDVVQPILENEPTRSWPSQ